MPSEKFSGEVAVQRRRFFHLGILRLVIAVGYLALQVLALLRGDSPIGLIAGVVFGLYAAIIVLYRDHQQIRSSTLTILGIDLAVMILLVLLGSGREIGIPLLLFYFLICEAALLQSAREVLILTSISVVFYAAWLGSGSSNQFRFSFSSFMFMLTVGGALGIFFTYQAQRMERKISGALRRAAGQSETEMVAAVEDALDQLTQHFKCSRAILAFWDSSADYYAISQHPHQRGLTDPPPVEFDHRQEWACFTGRRLDFHTNDVSIKDKNGQTITRDYDLHAYVIQKFEIYNAVGCGLHDGDKSVGRLLLVNSVKGVGNSQLKKLKDISHLFADAVRHLLVVRKTEHEAYERERTRIAHDLHDGPLQSVISFEMRLQIIRKLREVRPEQADEELDLLHQLSRKLVAEMRTFVHRMRPMESEDSSLLASSRRLIEGFQKESGIAVTLMADQNGELNVPGKMTGEVLKIAREALHNVYKHSKATHVLFAIEKRNNQLQISVDDNGVGFRFGGKYDLDELDLLRLGPRSIKQRVRGLGGTMSLESNPGHGANVRLSIPLNGNH